MRTIISIILINCLASALYAQKDTSTVVFKVRKPAAGHVVVQNQDEPRLLVVEMPATFDGGDLSNFNAWVIEHLQYPKKAVENSIEGKVYVQFAVNQKGKVQDVTVLRGVDPDLDQEAVRVIRSSPGWTAPMQNGKPVKQLFSLPVIFKLQK